MRLSTMSIKIAFFILCTLFLVGCAQQGKLQIDKTDKSISESDIEIQTPSTAIKGLGTLCNTEQECRDFCQSNRKQCEEYCNGNENKLCKIIFPSENSLENPQENEAQSNSVESQQCQGTKTKFDYAPVNLDKTLMMLPLGLMIDGHVTPVDHHYFQNFNNKEFDIEVYSPGAGFITGIGHMPGAEEGKDYHITIEHTCTISSIYIYVSDLPKKIKEYTPQRNGHVRIPVEAGEIIGYYKTNLDLTFDLLTFF